MLNRILKYFKMKIDKNKLSNSLRCSCGGDNIENLTPYDNKVKLYCIDCGEYYILDNVKYLQYYSNYLERRLLKIQFIKKLNSLVCQN